MGRENFALELTNAKTKTKEYVMIQNVTHFNETEQGTEIFFLQKDPVVVLEKVVDIERQGQAYGVLKVVKR